MADGLRAEIAKLRGEVKIMKGSGQAKSAECQSAIAKLTELRESLKQLVLDEGDTDSHLDVPNKEALTNLLTRRMFVVPSFSIYGGVAGLYVLFAVVCCDESSCARAVKCAV